MDKSRFRILALVLLILIISVYPVAAFTEDHFGKLPDEVKNIINKEELSTVENIKKIKEEFSKYLYKFENYNDEIDEELIKINRNGIKPILLSTEKAIEDVDFLFRLLKYGYAGYQYFGGDKRFNSAKDDIIKDIKEKSVFSRITTGTFTDILVRNLSFIQDGHFAIDNKGLIKRYRYFASPKFDFFKDEKGYYTYLEDEKAYLISVNNKDYTDYLKLSLNDEGKVIYSLGTISSQQNKYIKTYIQLKPINAEEVKDVYVVLIRQDKRYRGKKTPYNVYQKEGITVIEHRTASANPSNRKKLEQFAREASKFKDENFLIIDLRGNSGGSDIYARDWVENFTGVSPGNGLIGCNLVTRTANKMLLNSFKLFYNMEVSDLEPEYQKIFQRTESGWTEINYQENKLINNDNLVIVLIGSGVASAGESFVEYLKQLKNVIFIGTNTSGLVNFGNMGMCNLPNSNLEILFSKRITLETDFEFREGKGYYPDFWVNSEKALDLSIKFINNYFR